VHTRSPRGLGRALVGTGFSYGPDDRVFQATVLTRVLREVRDIRRGGSAALDLAWVACGRLDGFYEWGIKHWDRAAGMLLVSEAGGEAAVFDPGGGLDPCVVAAAADLYEPLRDLVTAAVADSRRPVDPLH
jgi:myo-inositol-1(or 4)-monophosphatase